MAMVPRKVESDVQLRPVTDAKFATVETGQMGDAIGRGLARLGAQGGQLAEQQNQIEMAYDQAAAKGLDNKAATRIRDMLWTGDGAFYSQQGFDALNARPVAEKGLNDLREEMLGAAKTERQRALFSAVLAKRAGQEREGIARYAVAQTQQEEQKQSFARQSLASQNAVLNADDPVQFETNVHTGLGEIRSLADTQGWSPERLAVEEKKFSSGVYASIAQRKALTDPLAGKSFLDANRDKVDPETAFALDKQLKPYLDQQEAYGDVARVMGLPAPSMDNGEAQPVVGGTNMFRNSIISIESNGQHFASPGVPKTSSAGAVGIAQVMPSTGPEAARLAGVPWDAAKFRNDPAYNARLGEAYWNAQLRKYGDPQLAAAAYNAGPGRVDKALDAARKGDGNWLKHCPPETRDYVAKFTARNGAVGSQQAPERHDLNQLYARVDALAEREGWTFERRERAKEQVDKYVARDERLLARQESDAQRQALDAIQKKGADGFTSTAQIPPNVWAKLAPDDRLRFQEMAASNAKPKAVAADGPQALTLNLMAINDPDKFKSTDLRMYQGQMTAGEFASIATLQAKARANPNSPEMVDHSRIWGTIKDYAPDLGLDLGQKGGKWKDEKARQSATQIFSMMQRDLNSVTGGKRQPTDDEIKRSFDAATLTVHRTTPGWLTDSTETIRRYEAKPGEAVQVAIPTAVRDRIAASLRRANRRLPSDTEIARIYYNHKGQAGFW